MRLKEIEARLAEIKEELNTRAAELTDEEITKLETEVTDLQEERTALLAAAENRNGGRDRRKRAYKAVYGLFQHLQRSRAGRVQRI